MWSDSRFAVLAQLLGVDRYSAIGRMAAVWGECADQETDRLESVFLAVHLGCDSATAVTALARARLGEDLGEGLVRIRGCAGRTDWLAAKRANGRRGGRPPKQATGQANRKPNDNREQTEAKPRAQSRVTESEPWNNPPAPAPAPAKDSTNRESRPRDGIACEPDAPSLAVAVEHQEPGSAQDDASAPLCPVPVGSAATIPPAKKRGAQGRSERTAQAWWETWDKWGQQNVTGWRSDPVSGPVIVSRALRELRAPRDQGGSELRDADIEHAMAVMRVRGQARGRTSSEPYYAYVLCWQRPSLIVEHRQQPLPRAPRQIGRAEPSPASAFGVGGKVDL